MQRKTPKARHTTTILRVGCTLIFALFAGVFVAVVVVFVAFVAGRSALFEFVVLY